MRRVTLTAAFFASLAVAALLATLVVETLAQSDEPTLTGTSWSSAEVGGGCRYGLSLHAQGRYRLDLTCAGTDGGGRVSDVVEGAYRTAEGRLTLGVPDVKSCANGRLAGVWTQVPLDYELSARGALTVFRGTEALQSFHRVRVAAAAAAQPGCAVATMGLVATSAD